MTERSVKYRNILLVQLGDIGDVVLTTPTIRAARETHPDARVSIVVRKPFGNLLLADPNLHEIIEIEKIHNSKFRALLEQTRVIRRLRQARYDLVIDLRTGDRGAILSFCTGAVERVGRYCSGKQSWHNHLFTKIVRDPQAAPLPVHPGADQSLRIVRPIGIDTEDSVPRLYVTPTDRARTVQLLSEFGLTPAGRWVTLNPFSRWKYKEWDSGKWGEAIDQLWDKYRVPSLLIGSRDESLSADLIVAGRQGHTFNLAGKTTLGELAALISMSTLHMGVDSAAPHIAAAVGTPSVTVHGPSDWRSWRTVDDMHKVVNSFMDCNPCYRMGCNDSGHSNCLGQMEAKKVIEVVDDLLCSLTEKPGQCRS